MENYKKKNPVLTFVLLLLLCGGLNFFGFAPVGAVVAAAYLVHEYNIKGFALAILPAAVCACFTKYISDRIMFSGYALCAITTATFIRIRAPHRAAMAASCIVNTLTTFTALIFEAKSLGLSFFDYITDSGQSLGSELLNIEDIQEMLIASEVIICIISGALIFLATTTLVRFIAMHRMRHGEKCFLIKPLAPMRFWTLSKNYTIGLIVAAAALIYANFSVKNPVAINYVVGTIFLLPVFMQGTFFTMYISARRKQNGKGTFIVWLGYIIMFPYWGLALGLADQFLRKRTHIRLVKVNAPKSCGNESSNPPQNTETNAENDEDKEENNTH